MTTIHFIGGEKGGVGKSVVARLLSQSFVDRSLPFVAFDADRSNAALLRYYADFSRPIDLERLESADQILESAIETDRPIVVDLPAQSHRALQRWFEQTDVIRLAREEGVSLVFWHVTDGGFDSVAHLERLLDALGNSVQFVVVQNLGRSKDFSQFDASPAHQRVRELGGRIVALPELDASVMYKIDRFGSSFWAAINTSEGPRALSRLERRRAQVWLDRARSALEPVSGGPAVLSSNDAAPSNSLNSQVSSNSSSSNSSSSQTSSVSPAGNGSSAYAEGTSLDDTARDPRGEFATNNAIIN